MEKREQRTFTREELALVFASYFSASGNSFEVCANITILTMNEFGVVIEMVAEDKIEGKEQPLPPPEPKEYLPRELQRCEAVGPDGRCQSTAEWEGWYRCLDPLFGTPTGLIQRRSVCEEHRNLLIGGSV